MCCFTLSQLYFLRLIREIVAGVSSVERVICDDFQFIE